MFSALVNLGCYYGMWKMQSRQTIYVSLATSKYLLLLTPCIHACAVTTDKLPDKQTFLAPVHSEHKLDATLYSSTQK
jgi:hypothetical protein